MFELFIEIVVTVAVLALYGQGKPRASIAVVETPVAVITTVLHAPEATVAAPDVETVVFVADEQVTTQKADYTAMSIQELKALGKQHNIPGWKAWKKPQTAIAKLEALAA